MKIEYVDLLGKEFEYDGRGPSKYDCWGLCIELYKRMGKVLPDAVSGRERDKINEQVKEGIHKFDFKQVNTPEAGCLVALMIRPPLVSHVGVMLDHYRFVHITEGTNVSVERIDSPLWNKRVRGFYVT